MDIGPNGFRPVGYWTKWVLDQMALDQIDIRPNGIRRLGFRQVAINHVGAFSHLINHKYALIKFDYHDTDTITDLFHFFHSVA